MKQRNVRETLVASSQHVINDARGYEEFALRELRAAGYRITMPRVQVIRSLADTIVALSAYAIHEKIVNNGGKIDVVSVYRILTTLQEVGLIHHIGVVDGYFPCRMSSGNGKQSEVVVFEDSGDVLELKLPQAVVDAIEEQSHKNGFEVGSIRVEILGTRVSR